MPTARQSFHQDPHPQIEQIKERLDEHEQVVEGAFKNTHLMAQQVSQLSLQVQSLADDVRYIRDELPATMTKCAIAIVGNPEVWAAARTAMRGHARDAAGNLLLGWLSGVLKAGFWGIVFLVLLWQFSGWPGVWQWIKSH